MRTRTRHSANRPTWACQGSPRYMSHAFHVIGTLLWDEGIRMHNPSRMILDPTTRSITGHR